MSKNVSASLLVNELLGYDSESEDSYDNDDSDDAGDQIDDEARGANSVRKKKKQQQQRKPFQTRSNETYNYSIRLSFH
jgi:hypothetical protein